MGRSANTKRNIIWGFLQTLLTVLLPFFVRTALIYRLGADYVGLNSFLFSLLSLLSLTELGFGSAIGFSMYRPIAEGDDATVLRLLEYFKRVYRVIGLIILATGCVLMPFLDAMIEGPVPDHVSIQAAFAIYLFNVVIGYMLVGYKQTLLAAHQRNDIVSKVSLSATILLNVVQIIVLFVFPDFYVYALVMPVCTILQNIVIHLIASRLFPQFKADRFLHDGLTREERKLIRQRVMGLLVYKTCQVTRDSCDSIFISMFLGLTMVACYSNYFLVTSSLLMVLEVICTSMTASVGNSVASESPEKNFQDMRLFMFLYSFVSTICLSCLICLYQLFIALWVGSDLMLPDDIVFLLCVYFQIRIIGDIRSVYVDATGTWWKLKGRSIIEVVLNIGLNFCLVQVLGVAGVIIATIVSMVIVNYLWGSEMIFSSYFKNGKLHIFFLDNLLYSGAALLSCVVSYVILADVGTVNWLWFVLKGAFAILISSAVLLVCFGWTKRFRRAVSFALSVLRKPAV